MITEEAIDRIVELGSAKGSDLQMPENGKAYTVVAGNNQVLDLSEFYPPTFVERTINLRDAGSFGDYVNRFKDGDSLIFADLQDGGATMKAILDYHTQDGAPGRCSHVAMFQTIATPEWTRWMGADRKPFDQVGFATWLEDSLPLFKKPTGAELLELVSTLEGKNNVRFISAARLNNGANKLDYEEDVVLKGASSVKGESLELPRELIAGISPFQGAPLYEVRARLKYRIESRALKLWFETVNPQAIIRDSVMAVVKQVADKTDIVPFIGMT